jgi:proteic killer suppression protein
VIRTFADRDTRRLFEGEAERRFLPGIRKRARLKLAQLHAAANLEFMMLPPSNRLETLKGERKGQHSIRINQQWLLCFKWQEVNAFDVEIVDYH